MCTIVRTYQRLNFNPHFNHIDQASSSVERHLQRRDPSAIQTQSKVQVSLLQCLIPSSTDIAEILINLETTEFLLYD